MYNGLTAADKGALLDAKAKGAEWVARDEYHSRAWGYKEKPTKYENLWAIDGDNPPFGSIDVGKTGFSFIRFSDAESVNIDTALAQIAEMETAQTPPTNKDVLLDRYRDNTASFASSRIEGKNTNGRTKFYRIGVERGYEAFVDALEAEIAYLNSAVEVGK